MQTIQAQLEWEDNMTNRGVQRFRNQQSKAVEARAHETSAGSRILKSYILKISDHIAVYLAGKHPEGRRRTKYAKLLDTVNTDKVSLFALRSVIGAVFNDGASSASICTKIGRMCEDELRFSHFNTEYKEYYETLIRDFERKGTTSYNHKRRVLRAKGQDKGLEWTDWSDADTLGVGALVISLVMESCDLVETKITRKGRRTESRIVPTQQCLDWITKHNSVVELTSPDRMPCLIPPADWVGNNDGGFYSASLRRITPLIKVRGNSSRRYELYNNAEMPQVLSAINAMQRTPWKVNTRVMEVLQEVWTKNLGCGIPRSEPYEFPLCPLSEDQVAAELKEDSPERKAFEEWKAEVRELHSLEKERIAKNLSLVRTMRIANEMKDKEKFWYVYQCDFRGRVYCTSSGLNPQGTDQAKGLIQFAEGKRLGKRGLRWFLINGANKYGYDKVSYDDRIKWVNDNAAKWKAVGEDPITNRDAWVSADKPYQFLAWCFEYSAMSRQPFPDSFVSHLPVGLDGSCNGLQHFSAMLRDRRGGTAVNLIPQETPADIYQDVADELFRKLTDKARDGEGGAINWLNIFGDAIPRGLAKKPVMTLPYGSTQQSCTTSIYSWQHEKIQGQLPSATEFAHCLYLSPILWDSISEVVIAARTAMDWIQDCSSILAKENHAMDYTSPIGFPVLQASMKYTVRQVNTQIGGRMRISIASHTNEINSRKQRQGSSPNLIHHVDACHMMMTINATAERGVTDFAMIHDDFGTHACDADILQEAIRSEFIRLHTEWDILAEFKRVHEERTGIDLPDLPEKGDLDLEDVAKSEYFFG